MMWKATALALTGLLVAQGAGAKPKPEQVGYVVGGQFANDLSLVGKKGMLGRQFAWPGTYFTGHFEGDAVSLYLDDDRNHYLLHIDDQPARRIVAPKAAMLEFKDLGKGAHSIRLEKITETQDGYGVFGGFYVTDGKPLPATRSDRQITFIGDSYTVGYGNTSAKRQCTRDEVFTTTDTSQAFGPIVARALKADYQINALSGHGIVRNYGGSEGVTVPNAVPYALFDGKTVSAGANWWQPQIIVIGLGTNDFSTPLNAGEKWKTRDALHADYEATYVAFVKSLRAQNPNAQFILMATDQADGEIQSEVKKVIARLNADGESRIAFLPMNGLEMTGCDWHPSVADDRKVADSLIGYIDAHPELWQGKQ